MVTTRMVPVTNVTKEESRGNFDKMDLFLFQVLNLYIFHGNVHIDI